jgi:hypothetical protein
MKVSGFSFIRNAVKYDYPVREAILSILPICDEFVIAVGNSDDGTAGYIRSINSPKIRIIDTVWDESLREGGRVLAEETNKALRAISPDSDWAFYIQGDEVFHENDLPVIRTAMEQWLKYPNVEGLLFRHTNFWGSYDFIAGSRTWQKKEIRVIRNDREISSWKDAMSFRKNGQKLHVKFVDACIFHYGWVKNPAIMQTKLKEFHKYWHDDTWIEQNKKIIEEFDFSQIDILLPFLGTHPEVMRKRIETAKWTFSFDPSKTLRYPLRIRILNFIYLKTGWLIGGFKNYKLIR